MATEGLRKLEKLILDKIRKRSIEISRNIYEANGCHGRRILRTSLPLTRAAETDLMEREEHELAMRNA